MLARRALQGRPLLWRTILKPHAAEIHVMEIREILIADRALAKAQLHLPEQLRAERLR
jgi:hypothetical protein